MALALFDLDETLLVGNAETAWFEYLAEKGLVDRDEYQTDLRRFGDDYINGSLIIDEYSRYVLKTLIPYSKDTLLRMQSDWLDKKILPMIATQADELLQYHKKKNDTLVIISAAVSFCVDPVAKLLGVAHSLSTQAEKIDGNYSGEIDVPACFSRGKIHHLERWLELHKFDLAGSHFYTDSHNDLPLLERVDHPIVVDADEKLTGVAIDRGWKQLSLR